MRQIILVQQFNNKKDFTLNYTKFLHQRLWITLKKGPWKHWKHISLIFLDLFPKGFFSFFFFWNTSIWCTINNCASIDNAGFFVCFTTLDMIWPIWPIWFVIQDSVLIFHDWILCSHEPFHSKIKDKNNWNYQ